MGKLAHGSKIKWAGCPAHCELKNLECYSCLILSTWKVPALGTVYPGKMTTRSYKVPTPLRSNVNSVQAWATVTG